MAEESQRWKIEAERNQLQTALKQSRAEQATLSQECNAVRIEQQASVNLTKELNERYRDEYSRMHRQIEEAKAQATRWQNDVSTSEREQTSLKALLDAQQQGFVKLRAEIAQIRSDHEREKAEAISLEAERSSKFALLQAERDDMVVRANVLRTTLTELEKSLKFEQEGQFYRSVIDPLITFSYHIGTERAAAIEVHESAERQYAEHVKYLETTVSRQRDEMDQCERALNIASASSAEQPDAQVRCATGGQAVSSDSASSFFLRYRALEQRFAEAQRDKESLVQRNDALLKVQEIVLFRLFSISYIRIHRDND